MQAILHYFLHFVFPCIIALLFYRNDWLKVYFLLLLTMLVDMDHLLANPIFDPCRCSVGFHLLHSYGAILIYFVLLIFKPSRIIAIGLLLHMGTDFIDCLLQKVHCS